MKYIFLVGKTRNRFVAKRIEDEIELHKDILIGSFFDAYHNLTLKSLMMLQWFQDHCHLAKFLLKVDDNVHVNLPLLLRKVHTYDKTGLLENSIFGHVKSKSHPIRRYSNPKWRVPKNVYPDYKYPAYTDGPAYLMSGTTALKLLPACKSIPVIHIEDVYITGLCRLSAKVYIRKEYNFCQGIHFSNRHHLPQRCATEHRLGLKHKRT